MTNNTQNKSGCFDVDGGLQVKLGKRNLLKSMAGIAGVTALAGCTITKNSNVTTVTLNTQEVLDYGNTVLSFAKAGIAIPLVATAITQDGVTIAQGAIDGLSSALVAFNKAANGKATVRYDDTSIKTAFDSIVDDLTTINQYIVQTITATVADSTVIQNAQIAANAADGLISIIKGLVDQYMSGVAPRVGAAVRGDAYVAEVKTWVASRK